MLFIGQFGDISFSGTSNSFHLLQWLQFKTRFNKVLSEMEVALRYRLFTLTWFTLLTLFILLKLLFTATTIARKPVYIVRKG